MPHTSAPPLRNIRVVELAGLAPGKNNDYGPTWDSYS